MVLPSAAIEWFPDSDAVPLVLMGIGLLLVLVAVWTARRRRDVVRIPGAGSLHQLPRRTALAAASAVFTLVALVVAVAGLV